jgi:hypothetical protein
LVQNKQRHSLKVEDNTVETSTDILLPAQGSGYAYSLPKNLAHVAIPVTFGPEVPDSMEVFRHFRQSIQANSGIEVSLRLGNNSFLPRHFQFIVRHHPDQLKQYAQR